MMTSTEQNVPSVTPNPFQESVLPTNTMDYKTPRKIKLVIIIFSIFSVGFLTVSFDKHDSRQVAHLIFSILFFFLSTFNAVFSITGAVKLDGKLARFDLFFHASAIIILTITGISFLVSVLSHGRHQDLLFFKVAASIFGFWTVMVYGLALWRLIKTTYTN